MRENDVCTNLDESAPKASDPVLRPSTSCSYQRKLNIYQKQQFRFTPTYFVSVTYEQASTIDLNQIRGTLDEMVVKATAFLDKIPLMQKPLARSQTEGLSFNKGPAIDNEAIIFIFAWVVMGFVIDNILRTVYRIGYLKKMFGFGYTMNEILILLAILAGIASFGFWGLVIGPSLLALTFAAANLYSTGIELDTRRGKE